MLKTLLLTFVIGIITFPVNAIHLVLVNPSNKSDPFWNYITDIAIATAKDLNITLDVEYSDANRIHQSDIIKSIANRKKKPDAVIFLPYDGTIMRSFKALETAKIPFVTLEQVFNRSMFPNLGYAMENYRYWLGEYTYDNEQAAIDLMEYLVAKAKRTNKKQKVHYAIGLGGDFYQSSMLRMKGFNLVAHKYEDVELNHVLPANWRKDKAKKLFKELHQKYGNTTIVFSASDHMALGVIEAAQDFNLIINKELFIGGFDWLPASLQAIDQELMTASMGGHFILASKAIVDLYDHLHGFAVYSKGSREHRVPLSIAHKDNVNTYRSLFLPVATSLIDFTVFSRHHAQLKQSNHIRFNVDNFAKAVMCANRG